MKRKKKHFLFGFYKFNIYYLDFPDFQAFGLGRQSKQKLFFIWISSFLFGFRLDPFKSYVCDFLPCFSLLNLNAKDLAHQV
jgi:hypothetical protein